MHAAVLQLAPVLAAEKSKVPYYIAGGLLVGLGASCSRSASVCAKQTSPEAKAGSAR